MKKETYGVLTFKSTHFTIQAEKILKDKEIIFKIIPTPREITISCGLAILFSLDDLDRVKSIIKDENINIDSIYKYTKGGSNSKAEKII